VSELSASGFLNPEQAQAYTAALLHLLGTQNPLHVLRETPTTIERGLERLTPAQLDAREAPGKWSTRMVVAHLADSELVGGLRIRMVLAHERPPLAPYDQDLWADRLHYERADVRESLDRFSALRRSNLRLWSSASPTELSRVGMHSERGEESLEQMLKLYAGHDLAHLHQLARIRIVVAGQ